MSAFLPLMGHQEDPRPSTTFLLREKVARSHAVGPQRVGDSGTTTTKPPGTCREESRLTGRVLEILGSGASAMLIVAGAHGPKRVDLSLQAQVRLQNLVRTYDSVVVCLQHSETSQRNSLASLRAASHRRRAGVASGSGDPAGVSGDSSSIEGRFSCSLRVVKDKKRGREWEHVEVFDGPVGLR